MTRRPAGAILMALSIVAGACSPSGGEPAAVPVDPVSTMAFELWDGSETSLVDLVAGDGKPMVVNLWATWCAPCLEEMPTIQAVHESLGGNVRFLGINVSDSPTRSAQLVAELGITYLQGRDPEGLFTVALGAVGLPVTAFVDSDGILAHVRHGRLDVADLEAAILEYLS